MRTHGARDDLQLHQSPTVRLVLLATGTFFVLLAVVGVFLPVLPTTPFLLVAAACYARGSERFYDRLLANRTFGPLIREWRQYRSIPYRAKWTAAVLLVATIGSSAFLVVENGYLRLALVLIGAAHLVFLLRIPSRNCANA